jgi:hypothetical protein
MIRTYDDDDDDDDNNNNNNNNNNSQSATILAKGAVSVLNSICKDRRRQHTTLVPVIYNSWE